MARTNLPGYTSVYKDPGSVAINTELRRRYANSFANDDKLTGAVDGMVNAQFEGDQMLKDDLSSRYNNQLQERSRRGDYETMGQNIARDSRQFVKEYAPIEQNYKSVQAYQLSIKKAYSEGKIDEETYRRAFAMSAHGYKGLQQNEDGSINDQSFFSGYNFVDDQNISALMDDAMKGYAAHEGGSDIQRVGQGPNAMYKMRVGNKYEIVPQSDVERIFNDVISDPSVKAYLNQKADLRTFDVSDEEMQKQLSLNLYGNPDDPNDKGLYGAMSELTSEGKDKEAEAYKNIIEQQENLLHGTGVESPEEMINMRKMSAKQQVVNSEIGRERNAALTKYVRDNRWTESIQEYDDLYKADVKRAKDNYLADLTVDTPLTELTYEGGDTDEQINSHIDMQKELQEKQTVTFNEHLKDAGYDGEALSQEQILAGDFQNIQVNGQPITDLVSPTILTNIQNNIRKHISSQNRSENILKAVDEKLGKEIVTADNKFRNTKIKIGAGAGNQSTTYGKVIDVMNTVVNNKKTVQSEIKELFTKGNEYVDLGDGKIRVRHGIGSDGKTAKITDANWKTEGVVIDLNNIDTQGYMNIMAQSSPQSNANWQGYTRRGFTLSNNLMKKVFHEHDLIHDTKIYHGVISNSAPLAVNVNWDAKIDLYNANTKVEENRDEYIKEVSKQYVGGQASVVIPGPNTKQAQANTKVINDALKNKPLPEYFQIYYDNQKQDGTGTAEEFRNTFDLVGDLTVKDIKFVTSPFMGEAVLQLQVSGQMREGASDEFGRGEVKTRTKTVFMPLNQIKNSGIQEYINSPAFLIELDVNAARQSPVNNTTIIFKKGSDDIGTTLTYDFNKDGSKNSETVLIQTADGGVQEFPIGDPFIALTIQDAVEAGYNFWTVKD